MPGSLSTSRFVVVGTIVALCAGLAAAWVTKEIVEPDVPKVSIDQVLEAVPAVDDGDVAGAGDPLPDEPLVMRNGETITLIEGAGKPRLIAFWSSTCTPCRAELAVLQKISDRYGDELDVIGISTGELAEPGQALLNDLGITFPQGVDTEQALLRRFGAPAVPVTVTASAGNIIEEVRVGAIDDRDVEEMLAKIVTG